eukprot:UN24393
MIVTPFQKTFFVPIQLKISASRSRNFCIFFVDCAVCLPSSSFRINLLSVTKCFHFIFHVANNLNFIFVVYEYIF